MPAARGPGWRLVEELSTSGEIDADLDDAGDASTATSSPRRQLRRYSLAGRQDRGARGAEPGAPKHGCPRATPQRRRRRPCAKEQRRLTTSSTLRTMRVAPPRRRVVAAVRESSRVPPHPLHQQLGAARAPSAAAAPLARGARRAARAGQVRRRAAAALVDRPQRASAAPARRDRSQTAVAAAAAASSGCTPRRHPHCQRWRQPRRVQRPATSTNHSNDVRRRAEVAAVAVDAA